MIIFERLNSSHNTSHFSCGAKPIDDYIKTRQALQEQDRNFTQTFVAIDSEDDLKVPIGFFTLSATQKVLESEPGRVREIIRPVELLYLARDLTWKNTGLGDMLLTRVFQLSLEASERVGLPGIFLTSTSQGVKLYETFQFTRIQGMNFWISMRQVRKVLEGL